MGYKLIEDAVIDRVGIKAAATALNGDDVVLNEPAPFALEAIEPGAKYIFGIPMVSTPYMDGSDALEGPEGSIGKWSAVSPGDISL